MDKDIKKRTFGPSPEDPVTIDHYVPPECHCGERCWADGEADKWGKCLGLVRFQDGRHFCDRHGFPHHLTKTEAEHEDRT